MLARENRNGGSADNHDLPDDWDDWMRHAGPAAGFLQTSVWARVNLAMNNAKPIAVDVVRDDKRQAAALFAHRRPQHAGLAMSLMYAASGLERGRLECLSGPVLAGTDPLRDLDAVLDQIDRIARDLQVRRVLFSGRCPTAVWPPADEVAAVFAAHGYRAMPHLTALVDLTPSEDALLASFKQAARKGIRKCREMNIVVRQCESADDYICDFSRPFFETRRALGGRQAAGREYQHTWHIDADRCYRYFVAYSESGDVLGTLGTYRWNGLATEIISERTMTARDKNMPVQDLLHWEVFRAHRALGDTLFDLAGFSPAPTTAKEAGIRSFKEKWRGRVVEVSRFERSYDVPGYNLLKSAFLRLQRWCG